MIRLPRVALTVAFGVLPSVGSAQTATTTLPVGTRIALVTTAASSSKTNVKGDLVGLRTAEDVTIDGSVLIPRDSEAVGQIADARKKGAMGMSGRLLIRPLYVRVGDRTVRSSGQASEKASVNAGAIVGTVALALPVFTGRTANMVAGTPLVAYVERTVELPRLQ